MSGVPEVVWTPQGGPRDTVLPGKKRPFLSCLPGGWSSRWCPQLWWAGAAFHCCTLICPFGGFAVAPAELGVELGLMTRSAGTFVGCGLLGVEGRAGPGHMGAGA